jgi:hypothetical protein
MALHGAAWRCMVPHGACLAASSVAQQAQGLCQARPSYISWGGCCVGRMPKRFFSVTRSRLNLSSGEKRAGCADLVGRPLGSVFCATQGGEGEACEMAWRRRRRAHAALRAPPPRIRAAIVAPQHTCVCNPPHPPLPQPATSVCVKTPAHAPAGVCVGCAAAECACNPSMHSPPACTPGCPPRRRNT